MSKQLLHRQVRGSTLVDNTGKFETLAALLGKTVKTLKLEALYNTRTSGWNPAAFHAACDNKGPTLVLIQCSDGFGYGGYNSVSWNSTGRYQADSAAFLFRLPNFASCCTKQSSEKFAKQGNGNDIFGHSTYGPTFGVGHDLMTFNTSGQILVCNGASSYATTGPLIPNTVSKDANSCHMEVLSVSTSDFAHEELEQPWLSGCTRLAQESVALQKTICTFNPAAEGLGVKTINILLCGGVGAGKSSIVSTVDSLFQGRISRRAPHGQGTGSLTRKLRKYKFTDPDTQGQVKWQLWDSMGWGANDYKKGELGFILDGNLPNGCKLDENISMKTDGFNKQPSVEDEVHCVCLVVPCDAASDESYMERLREMREFAREREIPTLVFLTKIDKYDPDVIGEDLSKTFHSVRLLSLMEDLEESSGVGGRKDILPIKNLSKETEPTPEAGVLVCRALQQALYAAVDYLRECDYMDTSEEDSELS